MTGDARAIADLLLDVGVFAGLEESLDDDERLVELCRFSERIDALRPVRDPAWAAVLHAVRLGIDRQLASLATSTSGGGS